MLEARDAPASPLDGLPSEVETVAGMFILVYPAAVQQSKSFSTGSSGSRVPWQADRARNRDPGDDHVSGRVLAASGLPIDVPGTVCRA
jgi:hypothetical protein